MTKAVVRAGWIKHVVTFADACGRLSKPARIVMPVETAQAIDGAAAWAWVPFEHYRSMQESFHADLGDDSMRDLFADFVVDLKNTPLYRPLLTGIEMFPNPAVAMIRLYARGFALSFREAGRMRVEPREQGDGVRVVLDRLPPICRYLSYGRAHQGTLIGGFRLRGGDPTVELDLKGLDRGVFRFEAIDRPYEGVGAAGSR